jgi:hypothetical protein
MGVSDSVSAFGLNIVGVQRACWIHPRCLRPSRTVTSTRGAGVREHLRVLAALVRALPGAASSQRAACARA